MSVILGGCSYTRLGRSLPGYHVGSVHCGYDFTPSGKLRRNDKEQRGIALARNLRATGWSYARICAELDRRGFKPKQSERWGSSALPAILNRRGQ
jgi:hypothetical protein